MAKSSAGFMMYRMKGGRIEILIAHPGGPIYGKQDEGIWSIPKGELNDGEDPLDAALREFEEETGLRPSGEFIPLGTVQAKSGKVVHAWAFEGDCDPASLVSNTFEIEWPPRSGRRQSFPENDKAEFVDLETAKRKLYPAQIDFLERLEQALSATLRAN